MSACVRTSSHQSQTAALVEVSKADSFLVKYECESPARTELVCSELMKQLDDSQFSIYCDNLRCRVCKQFPYDCEYFATELDLRGLGYLSLYCVIERRGGHPE